MFLRSLLVHLRTGSDEILPHLHPSLCSSLRSFSVDSGSGQPSPTTAPPLTALHNLTLLDTSLGPYLAWLPHVTSLFVLANNPAATSDLALHLGRATQLRALTVFSPSGLAPAALTTLTSLETLGVLTWPCCPASAAWNL